MLTTSVVRGMLPKVGDEVRVRDFVGGKVLGRVTYVNKDNLWYQVTYEKAGMSVRECYKLPSAKNMSALRKRERTKLYPPENIIIAGHYTQPCKIVETGKVFESLNKCADFLGVNSTTVRYAIVRGSRCQRRYHIVKMSWEEYINGIQESNCS